jgi:UDP-arabinose 4-epimerase
LEPSSRSFRELIYIERTSISKSGSLVRDNLKILVTGGAGYIGSHTAIVVERSGHTPVIFDNLSAGHRWAAGSRTFVEGDLADDILLRQAIERNHIEAVIHFAACAYVGESIADPRKYFRNNVVNTLNLLDAMVDAGVRHIVFSSSCATYGIPDEIPISEEQAQRPVNPYGESKLFVERMLHWYGRAYGLRWIALRYFNAAGASGDQGECHDPETHLVPLAIQAALTGVPMQVFGTDYPTEDGTAVRDYIHVDDLAQAHLLALEYLKKGGESRAFNLGTGQGYSVRQVLHMVEEISGIPVPHHAAPRRVGDPPVLVADNRTARHVLGWTPKSSSLRQIVESAWKWHSRPRATAHST